MTFQRIQQLISLLPDTSSYFKDILSYTPQITAVNKFLCAYKDLAFGYHIIKALVKDNCDLPSDITEGVLYKTYMFEKYGQPYEDIIQAIAFTHPSNKVMEDSIKAAVISMVPYKTLEKAYGISKNVLEAYEQLFFNIRDRKNEALFIANLVYPDTRFVELSDNYLKEEDKGKLLIRSAYNNGLGDASYFMGLKTLDNITISGMNSVDAASQLEAAIMVNGLFLARNGALNARNSGVSQARNILIAAKQGGQDTMNQDNEGIGSLGELAMQALKDMTRDELAERTQAIAQATIDEVQGIVEEDNSNKDKA